MSGPERVTLAMTGASGAPYGLRLLDCLVREDREVHFLISKAAQLVLATETDVALPPKVQMMQAFLTETFASRTTAEWVAFGDEQNTPICPINTPKTIMDDPQFHDRFEWFPASDLDADMLSFPVKVGGSNLPEPTRAPSAGQHTDEVFREVAGYDDEKIAALRETGILL